MSAALAPARRWPSVMAAEPLPDAEQAELLTRLRVPHAPAVMDAAREKLVLHNTRLAGFAARKRADRAGGDFESLLSHALVGLIYAVDHFRPELGNKFSTYAVYCIDGQMSRLAAEERTTIRIPHHVVAKDHFTADTKCGLAARRATGSVQMTDVILENEPVTDAEPDCGDRERVAAAVADAVAKLPGRLAEVVRLRFGLGTERRTLDEVGAAIGVTRERVRQLEHEAGRVLRYRLARVKPEGARGVPECGTCGGPTDGHDGEPCPPCRFVVKAAEDRIRAERAAEKRAAKERVAPCATCGTAGGRADSRCRRPKRVRRMCLDCYQAWRAGVVKAERAAKRAARKAAEVAAPKTAAPCLGCGTSGGKIPAANRRPSRVGGLCGGCYEAVRARRKAEARREAEADRAAPALPGPPCRSCGTTGGRRPASYRRYPLRALGLCGACYTASRREAKKEAAPC